MSYTTLRKCLIKMRAVGEDGFEGLAATLLSAATGDRFFVARSGDQPADAVSSSAHIAMQGKRYDKTRVDETSFEGEFQRACRLCPQLDCYVFAITRETAQLRVLAETLQKREGVDIIILEFGSGNSELASLCVVFWDKICHFPELSKLGNACARWAQREAQKPEVRAVVDRVRDVLTRSVPLAATVRRQLAGYLNKRFHFDTSSSHPSRFIIDLPNSVERRELQIKLGNWWVKEKGRAGTLIGAEGMGKSWVAAHFVNHLIIDHEILILWLDSADWVGASTLEELVDFGLMHAGYNDRALRERLVRKALARWCSHLLIVLDGVNERGARETAQKILAQWVASESPLCRLLFTTRPIHWRSDERALWESTRQITVDAFTEDELCAALKCLPAPVERKELPAGLVETAKRPRYFRKTVELRERFKSFANVSTEMVLWADLIDKIEAGNPQISETIGWRSSYDMKRALLTLAESARLYATTSTPQADCYSLLQKCFGEAFERIRSDLAEQRIILEPGQDGPALSMAHVTLGFALHLGNLAGSFSHETISEVVERLQKELEPLLSQDYVTEALFVALQLSAFPGVKGHALGAKARAALLFAWTSSQNSRIDIERLNFWANEDLSAYVDFAEELFVDPVSDLWEERIIAPLEDIWEQSSSENSLLDARLRRWLKLVWKSDEIPESDEWKVASHLVPVARSESQLSLSLAAIAILAKRPLESFLPDLAIAWATEEVCKRRHHFPKQPGGPANEIHDSWCKSIDHNLGALLRWCYTESIRPKIEMLLANLGDDPILKKGYGYLNKAFDDVGWIRAWVPEDHLRKGEALFRGTPQECRRQIPTCPELAIRDDFPPLCKNDQQIIKERVETAFSSVGLMSGYSYTEANQEMEELLPWYAVYWPAELAKHASLFRFRALELKELGPALNFANKLPYSPTVVSPGDLLAKAKSAAQKEYTGLQNRYSWSLIQVHTLAFTCFPEAELKDWLLFASTLDQLRREIHFYPMPILCRTAVSEELALFARKRAAEFSEEIPDEPGPTHSNFDFWAWLGGLSGPPDAEFHEWVDAQIREKQPPTLRKLHWLRLWLRSATESQITKSLEDGSILDVFGRNGWHEMWLTGRRIEDWTKLAPDLTSIIGKLPIDDAGLGLFKAKRYVDLDKWGHLLFARGLELVQHIPFEPKFWGSTIYETTAGEVTSAGCTREIPETPPNDAVRPSSQGMFSWFNDGEWWVKREKQANEAIRIWRDDQDRLQEIEADDFARFGGSRALECWRDRNPKTFRKYAETFLTQSAKDPRKAFHVAGFVAAVIAALIPLDPILALDIKRQLRMGAFPAEVLNEYSSSTFDAAIWREICKGTPQCWEIGIRLLETCQTDEKIMMQCVTALAAGGRDVLLKMCESLLQSMFAKQRCLAISILAWIVDPERLENLERLAKDDPSGWAQKHAAWAAEVARQEICARRYYAQTLKEQLPNMVLARLQALLPALTFSARWWHFELETQADVRTFPVQVQTALDHFWYSFSNKSGRTHEYFGRKLSEYLRGERIHSIRSPRLTLIPQE